MAGLQLAGVPKLFQDDQGREHLGTPLKFKAEPAALDLVAPAHGQHGETILREIGYDADTIDRFRAEGVI